MSSMLDYHTPHLSLPDRGHGEGGDLPMPQKLERLIHGWSVHWLRVCWGVGH